LELLGFAALAACQVEPYRASRRLDDLAWLQRASPSELRDTAHEALGFWLGDPHDAFAVLETCGDRSSIPFLRGALARHLAVRSGAEECTWVHGRAALDRVLALPR
jgi:hypothetical protein